MRWFRILRGALLPALVLMSFMPRQALGNGGLHKVKHIIIVMQENHSFDNYFGALAYAPGSPFHTGFGGCQAFPALRRPVFRFFCIDWESLKLRFIH